MATSGATNIESAPTEFVDRREELGQLTDMVEQGEPLITLVGAAGAGKTRLARELGRQLDASSFEGGIWFCELADARNRDDVVSTVAEVLEVSLDDLETFRERRDRVARAIAGRGRTLLVLDNFEQVVDVAGDTVGSWLESAETSTFVVTSRQRLRLAGERCFDVEALPSDAAVDLFGDRARRVRRTFAVDDDNYEVVAELVEHLDGLPLAVELAAARVRSMSPAEMVERIESRFQFLRSSERDSRRGQATLEEAIDWSWSQLDAWERNLLVQCAIFRGGFSLEAAETVCKLDDAAPWMADAIEALVDKSLLRSRTSSPAGKLRFDMYESIRAFVLDSEAAERTSLEHIERRHAEYFVDRAVDWLERADLREGAQWRRRLRRERENLYAAFERLRDRDADLRFACADALARALANSGRGERRAQVVSFMIAAAQEGPPERKRGAHSNRADLRKMRGDLAGAIEDLEVAIEAADDLEATESQVELRLRLGDIARERGELDRAVEVFERALELAESDGHEGLERATLAHLASCSADRDELEEAQRFVERAESCDPLANIRLECMTHRRLAYVHYYLENFERQRELQEGALDYARELESRDLEGECLQGLADAAFAKGDYEEAVELYEEALEIHRHSGNRHLEGILLGNLGAALHRSDRLDAAERRYREALEMHRETGTHLYRVIVLHSLGVLAHERDDPAGADEYYRRAIAAWEELESPSDRAAVELCASWLKLQNAETERAEDLVDSAAETFEEVGELGWSALAAATRGLVRAVSEETADAASDAGRARDRAGESPDTESEMARHLANRLEGRETGDAGELRHSLYGRALLRTLDALGAAGTDTLQSDGGDDASTTAESATCIELGPEARWCRLDDEVLDLRRRGSIRRVLDALAEHRVTDPAEGLDVYELFEIGWPDDEAAPKQAADRVYWAIRTLRDLGFRDLLITSDDGYFFDPDLAEIERSEAPIPDDAANAGEQ